MKKIALSLLFALLAVSTRAQNDKGSVDFIRAIVHSDEKIVYTDSIGDYAISFIKEGLHRSDIYNSPRKKAHRRFPAFTAEEKRYINKELNKMQKYTWRDSLLSNYLLVKQDTINKVFNSKLPFDAWSYFDSHFGSGFYNFSKPIFLRNHTICIFYKGYSCGWLCGNGDVIIYIKKKGKWIAKYVLESWIS